MLVRRAWFPSHLGEGEKKRARPFLELGKTFGWRERNRDAMCARKYSRADFDLKNPTLSKQSRDFFVRGYRKCIYTVIRALAAALHQRHGTHRVRVRYQTIPFVVVSEDETGVTARACETSRARVRARGTSNWLKTVITEPRFESAHYFGGDVKGTSTCDWSKERNCRAAEVQRSVVNEKRMHAQTRARKARIITLSWIDLSF